MVIIDTLYKDWRHNMKINSSIRATALCLMLVFILVFVSSCGSVGSKTYTKDEALSMFNGNRLEFDSIAQIVTSNKSFFENEYETKGGAGTSNGAQISSFFSKAKQYFSQDDWDKISKFLSQTSPYMLVQNSNSILEFDYYNQNHTGIIAFYYFGEDNPNVTQYSQMFANFDKLDDNWYMGYGDMPNPFISPSPTP